MPNNTDVEYLKQREALFKETHKSEPKFDEATKEHLDYLKINDPDKWRTEYDRAYTELYTKPLQEIQKSMKNQPPAKQEQAPKGEVYMDNGLDDDEAELKALEQEIDDLVADNQPQQTPKQDAQQEAQKQQLQQDAQNQEQQEPQQEEQMDIDEHTASVFDALIALDIDPSQISEDDLQACLADPDTMLPIIANASIAKAPMNTGKTVHTPTNIGNIGGSGEPTEMMNSEADQEDWF